MCVSGVRSGAVSCERVCVSCEWASRRSSVVRREAFSFALRFVRDSEVFVSSFEFEFLFRVCCRISNSNFSFRCSVRFLDFRVVFWIRTCRRNFSSKFSMSCSIRLLESRFEFVVEFDFSNFAALFDFSNFDLNLPSKFLVEIFVSSFYSTSRISLLDSISRISISRFEFSIQVSWISNSSFSSSWSIRLLELWFAIDDFKFVVEIVVCEPNS